MFSDLVGSTALSARMDPEDLREVISAYQKCVAEVVRCFGGFVAKYMGDGVLVYFGYPQAHEDGEPFLGVGDVGNDTIDPGVSSRDEGLLHQSDASIIEDPHPVVLVGK
jgi:class 3 adenylate cyclase